MYHVPQICYVLTRNLTFILFLLLFIIIIYGEFEDESMTKSRSFFYHDFIRPQQTELVPSAIDPLT